MMFIRLKNVSQIAELNSLVFKTLNLSALDISLIMINYILSNIKKIHVFVTVAIRIKVESNASI